VLFIALDTYVSESDRRCSPAILSSPNKADKITSFPNALLAGGIGEESLLRRAYNRAFLFEAYLGRDGTAPRGHLTPWFTIGWD
jgi:hypothetical protein